MKKSYQLLLTALPGIFGLATPLLAQTYPRAIPGGYDRTNETDNVNYENLTAYKPCKPAEFIRSDLAFQGYEEARPSQGIGEVTYYYRTNNLSPTQPCPDLATNPKVSKPLVVLDGFDPQDTRSGAELYGKYLKYTQGTQEVLLGNIVRPQGNDLIILNFPRYETGMRIPFTYTPVPGRPPVTIPGFARIRDGGADYMERNAFVLIKLIQQLNQELRGQNSTEKITLIGPSMGGLISRYALAYMEKKLAENPTDVQWQQQWDANVKLWISFDAPHLGANIPIGDQWMVNYLAGVPNSAEAKRSRDQRLASTAARQLLIHHFTANTDQPVGSPGFRDAFTSNLIANGVPNSAGQLTGFPNPDNDPAKVRKVALINGSQNGMMLPGSACGPALRVEVNKTTGLRLFLFSTLLITKRLIDATAYFSPANANNCKAFEGSSVYPLGIGIPGKTRYAQAFNSGASLDLAPGGRLDIQNVIASSALKSDNSLINVVVTNPTPNHSFIPTKSALAYNWKVAGGTGDLGENLSSRNLVCEGIIPFDTYYAPAQNEDHVFLTAQSADWILKEIDGSKQKPVLFVTFPITVSGQLSCTNPNSTVTASIPAQGAGSSYAWQVSGGIAITAGQGTSQITIQSNGTGQNVETIRVSAETACSIITPAPVSIQKQGGFSSSDYPISGPSSASCRQTVSYSTVNLAGATSYQWIIPATATNVSGQGTRFLSFTVPTGLPGMNIGLRVGNICDAGGSPALKFTSISCAGGRRGVEIYPNPADYELTVEEGEITLSGGQQPGQMFSVELYDAVGKRVRNGSSRNGKITLPVSQLPTGVYTLRGTEAGGQPFTRRVMLVR